MRLKCVSSGIPRLRIISLSGLLSMLNVVMPRTSPGSTPASSQACTHASRAKLSSERPLALVKSVAPMPTTAVRPA